MRFYMRFRIRFLLSGLGCSRLDGGPPSEVAHITAAYAPD
jgi:hypothetical protein